MASGSASSFLAVDNALGDLSARLQENVCGVQVVRAFAREPYEIERFEQANRMLYNARVTVIGEWSKVMPTTNFLVTVGTILILWFGGQMVLQRRDDPRRAGGLQQLPAAAGHPGPAAYLAGQRGWRSGGRARSAPSKSWTPSRNPIAAGARSSCPALSGQVEFRDVSLPLHRREGRALHDINLTCEPNQVIALIGPTGSGKTILINLIPRFYDVPARAACWWMGMMCASVDLVSLRRQIGIVLQTSLLFSASMRENIAYGRPDASQEEMIAAAKAAQAHDFIMELPRGL